MITNPLTPAYWSPVNQALLGTYTAHLEEVRADLMDRASGLFLEAQEASRAGEEERGDKLRARARYYEDWARR